MADNIVTANPGSGGALFKVDLTSGTSTPYMIISTSNPVNIIGSIGVSTGAFTGQVSSFPIGTTQVFGQVSSFPISTTFVTISSSQVALGGGTQYLDNTATTAPTGMVQMYKAGAANSTMVAVSTSQPLPTFIASSVALGFTPTGTSYVTIASSQISIGGGVQYKHGDTTTSPTGNAAMWLQGTQVVVAASSTPLPVYAISTSPHALVGTSQVFGQVSSFPVSTTYVTIASSQVALGGGQQYLDGSVTSAPTGNVSMFKVGVANSTMVAISSSNPLPVSTNTRAPLDAISSAVFIDNSSFVPTTSHLMVMGGYYVSTAGTLSHSDAGAARIDSTGAFIIAPGSAETIVSTTALVRIGIWNDQDQQVTNFGGGQQYVEGGTTTTPTGTAFLWKSLVSTMTAVSSSKPLPIFIASSVALGFTPTGTSFVTISSSQVTLGGGTQYVEGNTTTNPTGNVLLWKSLVSTVVSVSTSQPLPVYQISTGPVGPLVGTTQVFGQVSSFAANVVSTFVAGGNQTSSFVTGQVSTFANNVASTFVIGGSTAPLPIAQGGLDVVWYPSITTSPKTIKNSAGRLYDIWFTNSATSTRWMSLFNASSASASTGTTLPLMRFGLPGGTSAVSGWLGSAMGYQFSTAISVSVTASSATSTDTSAPGTNEVLLQFGYK